MLSGYKNRTIFNILQIFLRKVLIFFNFVDVIQPLLYMDLTLFSALLQELLIKNKRVALPGMGTFVLENIPSVFLLDGRAITPPTRKVYFRTAEIKNDGALEGAYAKRQGVSLDEAKGAVSLLIKEIRATLIENLKVDIPKFGSISFGESYSFYFTMDENFNVSPDTYPLEAISLKPETENAVATKADLPAEEKSAIDDIEQHDELRIKSYNDIISEWHKAAQVQEEEDEEEVVHVSEQAGVVDDRMSDPPKYDYETDKKYGGLVVGEDENGILEEDVTEKQDEFSADFVVNEVVTEVVNEVVTDVEAVQKMTQMHQPDEQVADIMENDKDAGYEIVDLSDVEAHEEPEQETSEELKIREKSTLKGTKKSVVINKWIWISLAVVILIIVLVCAVYLFRDDMRPILEKLLYSKEELDILRQTGRM